MMKLIASGTSPYARKIRVALIELSLADKVELTSAVVGIGKYDEEFSQKINPQRKYPVLILDNGEAIFDSFVIAEYLDELAGGGKLIPLSGEKRWKVQTAHSVAQGLMDFLLAYRGEETRPENLRWPLFLEDRWERVSQSLKWLETRPALFSSPVDIAQVAVACGLGYLDFRFSDFAWRKEFPALDRFYDEFAKRPSMQKTMPTAA